MGTGKGKSLNEWERITTEGLSGHAAKVTANSSHQYSAGTTSAYAVTDDGDRFVAGYNADWQLGNGATTNLEIWTKIKREGLSESVKDVFATEIAS
jgi:alpha-tubulin suppressor-like RCC1 family protein